MYIQKDMSGAAFVSSVEFLASLMAFVSGCHLVAEQTLIVCRPSGLLVVVEDGNDGEGNIGQIVNS